MTCQMSFLFLSDINMYGDDMKMIMEFHFSHGDLSVVEKTLQADVENVALGWLLIDLN